MDDKFVILKSLRFHQSLFNLISLKCDFICFAPRNCWQFMQRFLKIPVIAVVAVLLAIGSGAWWWHTRNSSPWSYRTATVSRGDVAATISASGTIEPVEVVDVGAQVAGLIKSFGTDINSKTVDYGSVVDEGAVLANIDDSVYVADLSVAKAGELSATANLEQMSAKLDQAEARVAELLERMGRTPPANSS